MSVRHAIAASLAGLLMIEAAGLAQALPRPVAEEPEVEAVVTVPRAQAIRLLLTHIARGVDVLIILADGSRIKGTIAELSPDTLIVVDGWRRQVVMVPDIVGVRLRARPGVTKGKAFGIGAGIGCLPPKRCVRRRRRALVPSGSSRSGVWFT